MLNQRRPSFRAATSPWRLGRLQLPVRPDERGGARLQVRALIGLFLRIPPTWPYTRTREDWSVTGETERGRFAKMSDWELVSVYINRGHGDNLSYKAELEGELASRKLPVPEQMPQLEAPKPRATAAMTRSTFLEYVLLIYIVTGLVYSWLYLPVRLVKGDFSVDRKHKLIQTAVALAYQALEVATACAVLGEL